MFGNGVPMSHRPWRSSGNASLVRIKASGKHKRGQLGGTESAYPSGLSVHEHVHVGEDEMFYLLEGELTVFCGDDQWTVTASSFVFVPRDSPHGFTVTSAGPARALATAMGTAARASILAAFTSGQGYCADADYSPRAWLINRTGIIKGAAVAYTAWARRAAAHPDVAAAMAAGAISESFARTICQWTGKLPEDCRPTADAILLAAALGGADLRDLAGLAGEIYARSLPENPDQDQDQAFEDRSVRLETTFQGAGVLTGDLTQECASVVTAVLDALSAPAGAEDTRTYAQRYHDALHEAMQRLVTAGLLPERAGQPVKAWVHISLADLMVLDGSSALLEEWTARVRAQWAAHRAKASVGGSDGGAWLDGDAAEVNSVKRFERFSMTTTSQPRL